MWNSKHINHEDITKFLALLEVREYKCLNESVSILQGGLHCKVIKIGNLHSTSPRNNFPEKSCHIDFNSHTHTQQVSPKDNVTEMFYVFWSLFDNHLP